MNNDVELRRTVGRQCRALRALHELTQVQLAAKAEVCRRTVVAFETGRRVRPWVVQAIGKALGADLDAGGTGV
jgi:DNA-binding XRE family transcriptional regulator